ncbi:MAG: diacylglycerol kinase [Opitutales bacterium]|nr:diacylglycerol kinase [Opitutales bacterium]
MSKNEKHFAEKQKSKGGIARIWRAFRYTCAGFAAAFCGEQAFRQEIFVFVPASAFVLISPIDWIFKAALLFPLALILAVELVNSAIEAVVDDISTDYRELAKRAKDFGSAAVFCTIVSAVIIWVAVISHCFAIGQFDAWFPYGVAIAAK